MATIDPNLMKAKTRVKNNESENKPEVKRDKVVTGSVRAKKNGPIKTIAKVFLYDNLPKTVTHITKDILEPAIKNTLYTMLADSVEMLIFGETRRKSSSRSSVGRGSYHDYYERKRDNKRIESTSDRGSNGRFNCEELVFDTRRDAENVLKEMFNTLEDFQIVTVFDLYEFSGKTPPYTSKNYGWTNLDNSDIRTIRDDQGIGYILKLTKPMLID